MTLPQILEIVHRTYPDEFTRCCWDEIRGRLIRGTGDMLAEFVVAEVAETYDQAADTPAQLGEAERVLTRATHTLNCLAAALRVIATERPLQFRCAQCGSNDVRRDALAAWCEQRQEWELCAVYDQASCEACGCETRLVESTLEPKEFL